MASQQDIFTKESLEQPKKAAERWAKITKLSEDDLLPDGWMGQDEVFIHQERKLTK